MKKSIKPVFNTLKVNSIKPNTEKEMSVEELNILLFGTSKPKPGQNFKDWGNKEPNFNEILKMENENEIKEKITHGKLIEKYEQNKSEILNQSNELINSLQDKKVPIHPKEIHMLKLEKQYSYDTIQLIESLKFLEFKKANLNKFINLLSVLRKKKDLKVFDFPEIMNVISFIRNNFESITPSYQISFIYSLSYMQNFDEEKPSLNNQNLVYEIITKIIDKINDVDIRGISNLTYSLQNFQMKNPKIYNFDEFFNKLEETIIEKISVYRKRMTSQDVSNIILAYCKTQNGSEEFYYIMQGVIGTMKDLLNPQDVAIILYSYANNPTCNEKLLEDLEDYFKQNIKYYKPKEICSILRAYNIRKMLNEDLKKKIIDGFIEKHEFTNAIDLAHFYTILCDTEDKKFLKYINQCLYNLHFTFTGVDLGVIFEKAEFIQKNEPNLYSLLQKQVSKIMKKGEFKGHDLKQIYLSVKELPFEGKYNLFLEEIEQKLERLKYY